jgi:hypothetical protein
MAERRLSSITRRSGVGVRSNVPSFTYGEGKTEIYDDHLAHGRNLRTGCRPMVVSVPCRGQPRQYDRFLFIGDSLFLEKALSNPDHRIPRLLCMDKCRI